MFDLPIVLAAEDGGNFLVRPETGPMIWTLIAFGITLWILSRYAFPYIQEALDRRQRMIEDSIDTAERTRAEARELLEEYRERLAQARGQADDIVARARKTAEAQQGQSLEQAKHKRDELLAQAQRDIEAETRRAIMELRAEVADLTVMATEEVTRKSLTGEDQKRLVQDTLEELDFTALTQSREGQ